MSPAAAPIVLIHGVGLDHRMWKPCQALLSTSGNQEVLALDMPGHGNAEPITGPTTLTELAAEIGGQVPERAHVVGFSLGALVAQRLALDSPGQVATLTLISSVAHRSATERAAVLERLNTARRDPAASQAASIARWTGGSDTRLSAEALEYLDDVLATTDHRSFLAAYEVFASADQELWSHLSRISSPTLVFTGADDPGSTPRMSRELARAIPDAVIQLVPGARHLVPLEQPDVVSDLILNHIRRNS